MRYPSVLVAAVLLAGCGRDQPSSSSEDALNGPHRFVVPVDDPPGGSTNRAPLALLQLGGLLSPSSISLDASQSSDPDGDPLTFQWTTTSGVITAVEGLAELHVTQPGELTVTVRVSDPWGASATTSLRLVYSPLDGGAGGGGGSDGGVGGGADGGVDGGAGGCPTRISYGNPDPAGDVTLPNADIIATAGFALDAGLVDLRVQFCAPPFPATATHNLTWCLDTDGSASTNACGEGSGADNAVSLWGNSLRVGTHQLNACQWVEWDGSSRVLRVVFPMAYLNAQSFRYKLGSVFGGSFGNNDWAPTGQLAPGMFELSVGAPIPPFTGSGFCNTWAFP